MTPLPISDENEKRLKNKRQLSVIYSQQGSQANLRDPNDEENKNNLRNDIDLTVHRGEQANAPSRADID